VTITVLPGDRNQLVINVGDVPDAPAEDVPLMVALPKTA
jgi:hypothetical protein